MIASELVQGAVLVAIAVLLPLPLPLPLPLLLLLLLLLVGVRAVVGQVFQPASRAAVPAPLPGRDLPVANSTLGFDTTVPIRSALTRSSPRRPVIQARSTVACPRAYRVAERLGRGHSLAAEHRRPAQVPWEQRGPHLHPQQEPADHALAAGPGGGNLVPDHGDSLGVLVGVGQRPGPQQAPGVDGERVARG